MHNKVNNFTKDRTRNIFTVKINTNKTTYVAEWNGLIGTSFTYIKVFIIGTYIIYDHYLYNKPEIVFSSGTLFALLLKNVDAKYDVLWPVICVIIIIFIIFTVPLVTLTYKVIIFIQFKTVQLLFSNVPFIYYIAS